MITFDDITFDKGKLNDIVVKYGNLYHPDNIPEEILNSKCVDIWSHIYEHTKNDDESDIWYIVEIKPSNTRWRTINKFNELITKYKFPVKVATSRLKNNSYASNINCIFGKAVKIVDENCKSLINSRYNCTEFKIIPSNKYGPCVILINDDLINNASYSCQYINDNINAIYVNGFDLETMYGNILDDSVSKLVPMEINNKGISIVDIILNTNIDIENVSNKNDYIININPLLITNESKQILLDTLKNKIAYLNGFDEYNNFIISDNLERLGM